MENEDHLTTSWGGVADWYDGVVESDGSYQKEVILPHLTRLLSPRKGLRVLDLACGQGFFSRAWADAGASVTGVDVAPELIKLAQAARMKDGTDLSYHVSSADSIPFLEDGSFDAVTIVLALQNIEKFGAVLSECSRVLTSKGSLFLVLNHPAFRISGRSSWEFDQAKGVQYRRLDGYVSQSMTEIDMHPSIASRSAAGSTAKGPAGGDKKQKTVSFHRPLQAYFKALQKSGLAVARLEEWVSHKESEKGPRQVAENRARREFPLFMMIEAFKV